ncbi:MAG: DNA polymerase III subunit delta [Magnetococcales bacterium]|nr:DNA polymerase III subunit delta [Magnetococcales bacterium]
MKRRSTDISSLLRGRSWPPAVLLYGPEQGEMRAAALRIQGTIAGEQGADADFDIERFHADTLDPERLLTACRLLPFMAKRRLVWVREAEQLKAPALAVVKEVVAHPNPSSLLLLTAAPLESRHGLRKVFEADRQAWCVPFYPLEGEAFRDWLRDELASAGLTAEPEALHYLAERLEGDTGIARQELEKLSLYLGEERHLRPEAVLAVVGVTVEHSPFALADSVADGHGARALRILDRLLERGEEPLALLGMIVARLRRLITLQGLLAQGMPPADAVNHLRPKPIWKEQEVLLHQAREVTAGSLASALLACQLADAGLKGVEKRVDREVMERLTMRCCALLRRSAHADRGG